MYNWANYVVNAKVFLKLQASLVAYCWVLYDKLPQVESSNFILV